MCGGNLRRGLELESAAEGDRRKGGHEVEQAGLGALVLPECLVVHEEVEHLAFLGFHPAHELLGCERPLVPVAVGEAESDVVAEGVVPEKDLLLRPEVVVIDVVGRLPAHDVAGTLGEDGVETHLVHLRAYAVGIDELGVAESLGLHAEVFLDGGLVLEHLMLELGLGRKGCERMVIGLAEELHAAGLGQCAEAVDDLRSVAVELLERRTSDGEGDLELALLLLDSIEKDLVHGEVALLGDPLQDGPVGVVVIVVRVLSDIEETIEAQPCGLMDLEIQTD